MSRSSDQNTDLSDKSARSKQTADRKDSPVPGVIRADEIYTLDEFKRRVGLRSIRPARKAGLRVHTAHKRTYVHGADWIRYLLIRPAAEKRGAAHGQ